MTKLSERVRKQCDSDLALEMRNFLGSKDKEDIPGRGDSMCKWGPRWWGSSNWWGEGYL